MIIAWMVAASLFALLVGVAARATESASRMMNWQGRAPWVFALAVSLTWPIVIPLMPQTQVAARAPVVVTGAAARAISTTLAEMPTTVGATIDSVVLAVWALVSAALLARLLVAQRALTRISRSARAAEIDGHAVLVTDGVGPAVIGIVSPRVAVPSWLTELDPALRALVMRHEFEYCRSRDTLLLWISEISIALMPWNLAVRWQSRRLRLALELDCDARTLHDSAMASTYGKLLLLIAQRQQRTRLAPMLAESNSHLSQRILAMANKSNSYSRVKIAALAATAFVATVAASSPKVTGDLSLSPRRSGKGSALIRQGTTDHHAITAPGSPAPRYPKSLKESNTAGEVVIAVVIDTTGEILPGSVKVVSSTNQLLTEAVIASVPAVRYLPAVVNGRNVREMITIPYIFNILNGAQYPYTNRDHQVIITGVMP